MSPEHRVEHPTNAAIVGAAIRIARHFRRDKNRPDAVAFSVHASAIEFYNLGFDPEAFAEDVRALLNAIDPP